jgi:hypothetical protein
MQPKKGLKANKKDQETKPIKRENIELKKQAKNNIKVESLLSKRNKYDEDCPINHIPKLKKVSKQSGPKNVPKVKVRNL